MVYRLWWQLHKCKWCGDFTLISKSIPTHGRLHLPHLSAQWNICQHLIHQHGCQLRRTLLNIRLHWDEGWKFRGLSINGKILWRWQQCRCFHANHPKPLEDQVKEGNMLNWPRDCLIIPSFTDSHQTTGTVDLDFRLDMNPLTWSYGAIVHVEAVSQPQMASWPRPHTQTSTHPMQTASTPSHSPLALSLCWPSTSWTFLLAEIVVVIT